ncbi:MAG: YceD family protein [Sphingomonadaceae bacterium]
MNTPGIDDSFPPLPAPEFSHMIARRPLPAAPVTLVPDEQQRAALARRFGLSAIRQMQAVISLDADGDTIIARGSLAADIEQPCAISGEDFSTHIEEPLYLRFVPVNTICQAGEEEIELGAEDCDEIPYSGDQFDLGEAIAQSLFLAIDPYAKGPDADMARKESGLMDENASGPFAALAALRGQMDKKGN